MRLPLLLTAILAGSPVLADCEKAATQLDMNQCAASAAAVADAGLNAVYGKVTARLADSPQSRQLLIQAQRAWIAFRDAECAFATAGLEGGSIQPMIYSGCVETLTSRRAADLAKYLDCPEGDLSCPLPPG